MTAKKSAAPGRTPFEIGVFAAAAAAILAVVAGLIAAGLDVDTSQPDLRATAERARAGGDGVSYEVIVRNEGGATAANVVVEVTVGDQTREVQLGIVVRGEEGHASVVFPPGTQGAAIARVLSFSDPGP